MLPEVQQKQTVTHKKVYRAAATITKCFYDPLTRVPFPILLSTPVVICLHCIIELKGEGEEKREEKEVN